MAQLFDTAPIAELPFEKGGDLHFVLVYEPMVLDDNGDPVLGSDNLPTFAEADWPDGASVTVTIDGKKNPDGSYGDPLVLTAAIDGTEATVDLDYEQADLIEKGRLWRAKLTHSSGLDEVLVKGRTIRDDG